MRNRLAHVPSDAFAEIRAVVDREGMSDTEQVAIHWVAPGWYRVGYWNDLDGQWEYTETVTWAQAVAALAFYGFI